MLSSPPAKPDAESTTVLYFRRTCEQIEQEIQCLLAGMAADKVPEPTPRAIEKYLLTFKQAVIRSISSRLPNILAAEEKYHAIISQVNEEANSQKNKLREIYQKYEENVLENDRLKIETVSTHELYQAAKQESHQLSEKLSQLTLRKTTLEPDARPASQHHRREAEVQAVDGRSLVIEKEDYEYMLRRIEEQAEQKKMYMNEIGKSMGEIAELKQNLSAADLRIQQLQSENQGMACLLEEEQESNKLLREEIGDVLLKAEEIEERCKAQRAQLAQSIDKEAAQSRQLAKCEQEVGWLTQALAQQGAEILAAQAKLEQSLQEQHESMSKQRAELEAEHAREVTQKLMKISELRSLLTLSEQEKRAGHSTIGELSKQVVKLKELSKYKQALQEKFGKKCELLTQQNRELNDKHKHLKRENERLYTAMDQYAANELKLNKKMQEMHTKIQLAADRAQRDAAARDRVRMRVKGLQEQVQQLGRDNKMSRQLREQTDDFKALCGEASEKMSRRLLALAEEQLREEAGLRQRIHALSEEYKQLQERCLESEINSGKVASSLLDSKKEVTRQLLQKDEIIKSLESELHKEREINENSLKKLGQVVQRYSSKHHDSAGNDSHSYDPELEKQVEAQKLRMLGLQREYQELLQR